MKRHAYLPVLAAFLLMIAAMCAGCDRQVGGTSTSNNLKRDPQQSFNRILDSFRRKVEDQPVGFVVSEGGSRSTLVGSNKVSSEFFPPANTTDHYKANINVTSQSQYSLHRTKNAEDADRDQSNKKQSKSVLESDDKKSNEFAPLPNQPSKVNEASDSQNDSKSKDLNGESITRRPDETTRKYELVYENDKWLLLTTLNPKTEKSIQFAFEEALSNQ